MAGVPKFSNPFEDETDRIDAITVQDAAKQVAHEAAKQVNKQVIEPTVGQINPNQSIVDFLYGIDETASSAQDPASNQASTSGSPQDSGIEQLTQGAPQQQAQAAKMQQIMDPDQQMAKLEKTQYTKEQLEEREKARLHQRNYYTVTNKLDDIGTLEEQVAKVRRQREEEEQRRKQEEEEEEMRKKQEEEEQKQQLAQPSGKRQGVPQEVLKREQNKAENKTGFSG